MHCLILLFPFFNYYSDIFALFDNFNSYKDVVLLDSQMFNHAVHCKILNILMYCILISTCILIGCETDESTEENIQLVHFSTGNKFSYWSRIHENYKV